MTVHTFVKASCHCGLNTFQIPFLTSSLPQSTELCHCTTCRHLTGQFTSHCAIIEGFPLSLDTGFTPETFKFADLSNLQVYASSHNVKRYFCKKCSAYVVYHYKGKWVVSTGVLEKTEGIVKVGYHLYVGDTLDGGLADHYRAVEGKELPRYEVGEEDKSKTVPVGWKADRIRKKIASNSNEDRLSAYCHCKTISLYITRNKDESDAQDPSKWSLSPVDKKDDASDAVLFSGRHCFCSSCRLTSGALFASYISLPRANVFDAHTDTGKPIELAVNADGSTNPNRPKGLKQYQSSPGTFRESCGTCGATVLYWSKALEGEHLLKQEAAVIDLAAGLVDEEDSGARADGWVSWDNHISHPEEVLDRLGVVALKTGSST